MAYLDEGSGPPVVLLHGFPENAGTWRHQIEALTAGGHRVIALNLRGFGNSEHPSAADAYTVLHVVGDLVALLNHLGTGPVAVIGREWGALTAWGPAMMRPGLVRGVVAISAPPQISRAPVGLAEGTRSMFTDGRRFYLDYLQDVGPADDEFGRGPRASLRGIFHMLSHEYEAGDVDRRLVLEPGQVMLDIWPDPGQRPAWMPEDYFETLVDSYEKHGFTGSLAFYRNTDRSWWSARRATADRKRFGAGSSTLPAPDHFRAIRPCGQCRRR
ncbi:alpha/beta hydrolase [Actinoplanes sp. TRM 88003]|uniref:Alpha/beta hydrolase n=1 Tax=Paractinoplanes aksuensis TaxID=2939490 RepID=A0ABT1DXG8_9ACTN|nr:alpha/beta hydrolase [Actinoplanes aksuensis]MCO8275513.1 alpha/beta hydrolase [Actinoplanes aksuensis]